MANLRVVRLGLYRFKLLAGGGVSSSVTTPSSSAVKNRSTHLISPKSLLLEGTLAQKCSVRFGEKLVRPASRMFRRSVKSRCARIHL